MKKADLGYRGTLPTRLPKFEYLEARAIEEACSFLSQNRDEAKPIAGGTDLLVSMRNQTIRPQYVINIKTIPDLDYIRGDDGGLKIGALTTLDEIETSPLCRAKLPMLAHTAHLIGTPQVRNVATIGGNLCNAAPSADTAPLLIGLGARAKIQGLKGERVVALEDFFVGPGQSVLQNDEILTEIKIPNPSAHTRAVYLKLPARTAIDIAVVGVAIILVLDSRDTDIVEARIVLGAVAPTPMRARKAESIISGKAIDDDLIAGAAQAAAEEAQPISDVRGSAGYRKEIVKTLTNRAIRQALGMSN